MGIYRYGERSAAQSLEDNDVNAPAQMPSPPEALAEMEAALLARPAVTLHAVGYSESLRAFDLLAKAHVGVQVQVEPATKKKSVSAEWAGMTFYGPQGIQKLSRMLGDFRKTLIAETCDAHSGFFDSPDPELQAWIAQLRERQYQRGREIIERLAGGH